MGMELAWKEARRPESYSFSETERAKLAQIYSYYAFVPIMMA